MTTKFVQPGSVIDYTAGSNIASGAVVVMSTLVGVALAAIASGSSGSVQIDGVFQLNKLSTDVIAQGDNVYWDASPGEITTTSAGNTLAGKAVAAAGNGTTSVLVKLNA
jgi:predicted RecA/RadA family phage recombinase